MICPYCGKEIDEAGLSGSGAGSKEGYAPSDGYLPLQGEYAIPIAAADAQMGSPTIGTGRNHKALVVTVVIVGMVAVLACLAIVNWQSLSSLLMSI